MAPTIRCVFSHILILLVNALNWGPAVATWYGHRNGDGSEGGACGFGSGVGRPPLSSLISAGNPLVFDSGKGCGSCYEVKCTGNSACSSNRVRVVITDLCSECLDAQYHFEMSGHAFGAMAIPGREEELRSAGEINIQFRRVECNIYSSTTIVFHVDSGSNEDYFATLIEYKDSDGDIINIVELKEGDSEIWEAMQTSRGELWKLNKGAPLRAPFSIRFTTVGARKTLVANNVIPVGWQPGVTYRSVVKVTPS